MTKNFVCAIISKNSQLIFESEVNMKNKLLTALLALSFSTCLFACGKEDVKPVVPDSIETSISDDSENDSVVVEDEVPPREGVVRSPLTNEWVDESVAKLRPLAVMVPNDKGALPHYNISNADILYECNVEGELTRLMAIFGDWSALERVGNVRSCRDYYVYWAFEWDAIYCHAGGPFYIDEVIGRKDTNNINALVAPAGAFFRSTDRSAPQNLYLNGGDIMKEANRLGYSLTPREGYANDEHFKFTNRSNPNTLERYGDDAVDATKIDLKNAYPITQTWFEYSEKDGKYLRFQKPSNGAHIDEATGDQLAFENVLIQFAYHEVRDANGYLAYQCIDNTRDGWYFTKGKGIHVNWIKTSDYGPTKFYDDNGGEIELNTGKTMICVVQDGDTFSYSN